MKKGGFSLIELLIAIGIVMIVGAMGAPFLSRFIQVNRLDTTEMELASALRKAQGYAMNNKNGSVWGVCFTNGFIRIYADSCNTPSYQENYELSGVISITGLSEVVFDSRGRPNNALSIELKSDIETSQIYMNKMGGLSYKLVVPTCGTVVSSDVPKAISSSGTPTITSSLNLAGLTGVITDVNLVSLRGSHTYIGDLNFNLTSPMGTTVRVMDNSCGSANDFDLNLDDQAPAGAWPCPPIGGGTYQPSNPLSNFNNQDPNGTWILTVNDTANLDGGSLDSWGLEVCSE